jgi:histone deacetylase 11
LQAFTIAQLTEHLLEPLRWGVAGTILAVNTALEGEMLVFSLAGGYHHAQFAEGGGFCIYSDIAIAIHFARLQGALKQTDRILYIDVDAHLGNGVAAMFNDDPTVLILDAFNRNAYPTLRPTTRQALARVTVPVPLAAGTTDIPYVRSVSDALNQSVAPLLDRDPVALAIVNLGYDPLAADKLGGLALTPAGISMRDRLILDELGLRGIPTVVLPGGGYSPLAAGAYAGTILERMAGFGFS